MDAYALLRSVGALAVVLGLLAGALWAVRRYNIGLPGRTNPGGARRLELIDRTTLDSRRSVALLRRDGREHLILLAPEGNLMLETSIIRDELDHAAEAARLEAQRQAEEASKAEAEALRAFVAGKVEQARERARVALQLAPPLLARMKSWLPARPRSAFAAAVETAVAAPDTASSPSPPATSPAAKAHKGFPKASGARKRSRTTKPRRSAGTRHV